MFALSEHYQRAFNWALREKGLDRFLAHELTPFLSTMVQAFPKYQTDTRKFMSPTTMVTEEKMACFDAAFAIGVWWQNCNPVHQVSFFIEQLDHQIPHVLVGLHSDNTLPKENARLFSLGQKSDLSLYHYSMNRDASSKQRTAEIKQIVPGRVQLDEFSLHDAHSFISASISLFGIPDDIRRNL